MFKFWNRQAEKHYRINSEYVTGKNLLEVFPTFSSLPIYHDLKRALKGETVFIPSSLEEETGMFTETYLIPMTNEKNQVTGVIWLAHDMAIARGDD